MVWLLLAGLPLILAAQWVVQLDSVDPTQFAARQGLNYTGPTHLPGFYIFSGSNLTLRSRDVQWAEKQVARKRFHRSPVTDPLYPNQWHLHEGSGLHAKEVWDSGVTGKGVTIAIVDDGLQWNHPDLQPQYVAAHSWDYNGNHGANPMPNQVDGHGEHPPIVSPH